MAMLGDCKSLPTESSVLEIQTLNRNNVFNYVDQKLKPHQISHSVESH